MKLNVVETLEVEGTIQANGMAGGSNKGGGSGGSIWITTSNIEGSGAIQVRYIPKFKVMISKCDFLNM